MYQKRVTRLPRGVPATSSSTLFVPPTIFRPPGGPPPNPPPPPPPPPPPVGCTPFLSAQKREYARFLSTPFSIHVIRRSGSPSLSKGRIKRSRSAGSE